MNITVARDTTSAAVCTTLTCRPYCFSSKPSGEPAALTGGRAPAAGAAAGTCTVSTPTGAPFCEQMAEASRLLVAPSLSPSMP